MTATPTPGDNEVKENNVNNLSARLRLEVETALRVARNLEDGVERVMTAIAALSALPAAGGEAYPTGSDRQVLLYLMQQFDCETWECPCCGHSDDCKTMDSADYLRRYLATTPPPDAAVGAQGDKCFCDAQGIGAPGVSCGDCPRDYAAPADVGAQGLPSDALIASLESREALRALARTLRDECHRLAAPAAGKGVDDGMRRWAQSLIEQLPGDHDGRNSWLLNHGVGEESDWLRAEHTRYTQAWQDWREGCPQPKRKPNPFRAAALTRQPVAGDGWRSIVYAALRSIRYNANNGSQDRPPHERLRLIGVEADRAIGCMEASYTAPAATPTDGEEGSNG